MLIFGAHPDDIEFGCGGVVALEAKLGRTAHFVVCSRGEAATNGTPEIRTAEANAAAKVLSASIEFIDLGGDSCFEVKTEYTLLLAAIIRRVQPSAVLAPSLVENQHGDHWRLGRMVQDAARLARYGGMETLKNFAPHSIDKLFFYAVTADGEPQDQRPLLIDISHADVISSWTAAMSAHASQASTRNYLELQLTRARLYGARAGVEYACPLFPADMLVFNSLSDIGKGARRF